MIALLLLIAAVIITFLDISHYWLDDETKNILYFDTDNSSSNGDTSDSDTQDASESEADLGSDSEIIKHLIQVTKSLLLKIRS